MSLDRKFQSLTLLPFLVANYSTVTVEKHKFADFVEKSVKSAAAWNKKMNQEKKEKRRSYFDMQTFHIHYPMNGKGKGQVIKKPKVGHYPIALIPGQFVDHYKTFTPSQLGYLPLNTTLKGPPKAGVNMDELDSDGRESDSSSSDDEDGSSSSSSSGSSSGSSSSSDSEGEESKAKEDVKPKRAVGKWLMVVKQFLKTLNCFLILDAIVPGASCMKCTGDVLRNKLGQPEKLLHCSKCNQSCHPTW